MEKRPSDGTHTRPRQRGTDTVVGKKFYGAAWTGHLRQDQLDSQFGHTWVTEQKTLCCATPLARAREAKKVYHYEIASVYTEIDAFIYGKLQPKERRALEQLAELYGHVIASH